MTNDNQMFNRVERQASAGDEEAVQQIRDMVAAADKKMAERVERSARAFRAKSAKSDKAKARNAVFAAIPYPGRSNKAQTRVGICIYIHKKLLKRLDEMGGKSRTASLQAALCKALKVDPKIL